MRGQPTELEKVGFFQGLGKKVTVSWRELSHWFWLVYQK
jgi:hypothetical protein